MRILRKVETSFAYQLLLFLVTVFSGFFLAYLLFLAVVLVETGFDVTLMQVMLAKTVESPPLLRLMQTFQSFCVFILPSFLLTKFYKESMLTFLHWRKPQPKSLITGILSIFFAIPLINLLGAWNAGIHLPDALHGAEIWMRHAEDAAEEITQRMLSGTSASDLLTNIGIVGILAGVGEELLFRGVLQSLFVKAINHNTPTRKTGRGMHIAIWSVALFFSTIHLQFYGFIPRLLLGAWFGYLLWWSGSIWVPIAAHFTNNTLSTVTIFLQNKGTIGKWPDTIGLDHSGWWCLLSLILLTGCVLILRNNLSTPSYHNHRP